MVKALQAKKFEKDIFDKFYKEIFNFILYRVNFRKEIAEDLTSEIFLKIWENRGVFDPDKSSLKTWIYTIARNHLIDWTRTKVDTQSLFDNTKDVKSSLFDKATDQIVYKKILKSFGKISRYEREVVQLRFVQQLKIKEISQILNRSENAITTALSRALNKLKLILNDENIKQKN